jgi:hypothetical protein
MFIPGELRSRSIADARWPPRSSAAAAREKKPENISARLSGSDWESAEEERADG